MKTSRFRANPATESVAEASSMSGPDDTTAYVIGSVVVQCTIGSIGRTTHHAMVVVCIGGLTAFFECLCTSLYYRR